MATLAVDWADTGAQNLEPIEARFGDAVSLEGYGWQVDPQAIALTLRWATDDSLDTDYTVFVHLVDPADGDRRVAQGDAPPLSGQWPTSLWLPGMALDDTHLVPLPPNLAAGTYDLLVGLYDPATGARLLLPDGRDAVRLAGINLP